MESPQIRHYVKTCVPIAAPPSLLCDYRVHYGHGRGIGYGFIIRLIEQSDCQTVQQLHEAQRAVMIPLEHVPAPWEVESFYYPANREEEALFSVRATLTESAGGTGNFGVCTEIAGKRLDDSYPQIVVVNLLAVGWNSCARCT